MSGPSATVGAEREAADAECSAGLERSVSSPRLTLYVRAGCHLCEDMRAGLEELFAPDAFALELVNIDTDPALRTRYDTEVPVLADGEEELCRHFLDPVAVGECLASYNERWRAP